MLERNSLERVCDEMIAQITMRRINPGDVPSWVKTLITANEIVNGKNAKSVKK